MPRAGFEPATPATKRPQTYAINRVATGIGCILLAHDLFSPVPHDGWWLPFDLLAEKRRPRPECRHARPGFIPKNVITWVRHRI
jgi:hypothetical protein